MQCIRMAATALAVTLLMALVVGGASANNLSLSNRNIRIVWNSITFFGEGGIEAETRCPLTLEGSFHEATTRKVEKTLLGFITRAFIGRRETCTGGAYTILTETLPWHITYNGFTGTLPRITSIRLLFRSFAYLSEVGLGSSCLYKENGTSEMRAIANVEAGGAITGLTADENIRLPLFRGTFGCPTEEGLRGTGTVTLLGNTSRLTIRLI